MTKFKLKKNKENKGFIDIYGFHAVQAALVNKKRKHKKLVISKVNTGRISQENLSKVEQVVELSNKEMSQFYGSENNHQGIVLTTSNLIQPSIEEILEKSKKNKNEIIVMLDQVTDPNNIGSIMRSCSLFNCKTLIVAKNNSPDITTSIAKAASGALEIVNYIKVTNLVRTINKFKNNNFWVYGLDNNKKIQNEFNIPKKCLLLLGAEGKGLRQLTIKECDEIISIPIEKNSYFGIESLNVSNACSIALYEHFKKFR